jgi:hypothetical protein
MNGMTIYDIVRIERQLAIRHGSRRPRLEPARGLRSRIVRRRTER